MSFNWQDAIALTVVAAATWYLLRVARAALVGKKGTACGGCPKCASGPSSSDERLVVLDVPLEAKPEGR
jgi:hypothetical protein